ncbi:MAG: arginase family protein [Thermomicrobiales bacterium]|nr:arginase family protein [Thermomicrobiales bacterium]
MSLIEPVPVGDPSFLNAPRLDDLGSLDADIAVFGVVGGPPYDMEGAKYPAGGATQSVRAQSQMYANLTTHYDFDFGGSMFADRDVRIVDCGDVAMEPGDFQNNTEVTRHVTESILARGAVPFAIGGSHEISIPIFQAFADQEPFYLVQIDAHYDWRDDVNGVREGLSSVMRRASEMPHVLGMAQIGLRGVGSARQEEADAALAYGKSLIIGAEEVHSASIDNVIDRLPDHDRYYVTFDIDGMDPTIAPAVGTAAFGGLGYYEAFHVLRSVAQKGKVVGFDLPVVRPHLDVSNRTSLLAARMMLSMIGWMAHTGQIGQS